MKIGLLLSCALPFALLVACGGGEPAQTKSASDAANQPAKPGAPANTPEPGETGAGDADAGEQDAKPKRVRRPKVDYRLVKTLFGNETPAPKAAVPSSDALIALGNALYHSEHLSKSGKLSCASCHDLGNYGVDNKPTSPGPDGNHGARNTPTTYNAFRQFTQFWDGRAEAVESPKFLSMLGADAHGAIDEAALVTKIKEKAELVAGFKQAFPGEGDPVTAQNFGTALGAFGRTLVTSSKWDEYLDGNQRALSNLELLGLDTFIKVGCTTCHVNRGLGGHMFQKAGLLKPYPSEDTGRMQVTEKEADKFMFKVPTLLNVEKTAPYCHDGQFKTLEETVILMGDIQLARKLTADEVDAIVAFLKATTGKLPEQFAKK